MAVNYYIGSKALTKISGFTVTSLAELPPAPGIPTDAQLFILDDDVPETAMAHLRAIRQASQATTYLRPVVLAGENPHLPAHLITAVDGHLKLGGGNGFERQQLGDRLHAIDQRINALDSPKPAPDQNIGLKILRLLYTREAELRPLKGLHTPHGYSFPLADPLISENDAGLFQVLTFLKNQGLIKSSFEAKTHLCGQCQSAFLNFMEICPQCGSPDMHSDDLIHHFECGFVGNEDDFGAGRNRTCPKCRTPLRQLGVDYDKPSAVSVCNACGHTSQDPPVSTQCYSCGAQAIPENLLQRTIERHTLTGLGRNAARFGLDDLFRVILDKEVEVLPLAAFRQFLEKEIERIKRYEKAQSSLGMIALGELEKVYLRLGDQAADIFAELSAIIRSALRDSDIIASMSDAVFFILLVETPDAGAREALTRLETNVTRLLDANLAEEMPVRTAWKPLSAGDTAEGLIEALVPA
jgi:GGDEF domain-containing protein